MQILIQDVENESDPYLTFLDSLKGKAILRKYRNYFLRFLRAIPLSIFGISENMPDATLAKMFVELSRNNPEYATKIIIAYVKQVKKLLEVGYIQKEIAQKVESGLSIVEKDLDIRKEALWSYFGST